MEFSSALDYVVAAIGILIIVVSFAWNIYEVFIHKASQKPGADSDSQSSDSSIR